MRAPIDSMFLAKDNMCRPLGVINSSSTMVLNEQFSFFFNSFYPFLINVPYENCNRFFSCTFHF